VTSAELASIKFTSGSTGTPKGVMLHQGPLIAAALAIRERLAITPSDVYCTTAPMFHAAGSVWGLLAMMMGGGALVFPEIPEPSTTVELMVKERCTIRFGFPSNYLKEMEVEGVREHPYTLRALFARPPALAETLRSVYRFDAALSPYGLTETYGPVAVQGLGSPRSTQGGHSCGYPLRDQEVKIVDPDGRSDVAVGAVGRICVRGRVTSGYWGDPAATRHAIDDAGWLHTDDLGSLDANGYLRFAGRVTGRLKVGGENVSAEEIERLIADVDGVRDVVVVPVDDAVYGEVPAAFVNAEGGLDANTIIDFCRENAAWFKVPQRVYFPDEFPLLGNGKPDRVELARLARQYENHAPSTMNL
jgi:fatty-acyl-CoA synthase